jgi:hypothetical protein
LIPRRGFGRDQQSHTANTWKRSDIAAHHVPSRAEKLLRSGGWEGTLSPLIVMIT